MSLCPKGIKVPRGGIDPTKTVIAADRVLPKDAKVLHFLKEFGHGVRFL